TLTRTRAHNRLYVLFRYLSTGRLINLPPFVRNIDPSGASSGCHLPERAASAEGILMASFSCGGRMVPGRAFVVAILASVALLSLGVASRAIAEARGDA